MLYSRTHLHIWQHMADTLTRHGSEKLRRDKEVKDYENSREEVPID